MSWTKTANASGYIIIAINVNDISGNVVAVPLNDGDLERWAIDGLSPERPMTSMWPLRVLAVRSRSPQRRGQLPINRLESQ